MLGLIKNMKIAKIMLSYIILALAVISTNGCDNEKNTALPYVSKNTNYLGLKDSNGNVIKGIKPPQKIVSLTLRSDEILLDLAEPENIRALSKWADDPLISNVVEKAKNISRRAVINEEAIIELEPDLVVLSQSQPYDLVHRLRNMGILVYVCPLAKTVQDTKDMILDLGILLRREDEARKILADMNFVINDIQKKADQISESERVTVYRFSVSGGNGGKNSYYDDICRLAGVINTAGKMHFRGTQLMPKEQVVQMNPDVIFLPTWDYSGKIDLEEYKKEIKKTLEDQKQEDYDSTLKSEAWQAVVDNTTVQKYSKEQQEKIDEMKNSLIDSYKSYAQSQGTDYETYITSSGQYTVESFEQKVEEAAQESEKQTMIAEAIADKEKIKLDDKTYKKMLKEYAKTYGFEDGDAMEKAYSKDTLKEAMLTDLVKDWLVDNCIQKTDN